MLERSVCESGDIRVPDQVTASWLVASFALAVVTFLVLLWAIFRWKPSTHEATSMFQAVLTGAAILVAGYWYLVERRGTPHADISQTVTVVRGSDGYAIVEAALTLKNLGSVLVKVREIDVRVQRADPTGLDLKRVAENKFNQWPAQFPDGQKMYDGTELQWPTLQLYRSNVNYEIEPGESDTATVTFVVSCDIRQVRIASEVKKSERLWWKARTFSTTYAACEDAAKHKGKNRD